jgi:poly(3-hydroxybutyrate) depolymerase
MNEVAESENFIVLYPDQPATANQNKFWNWFETAHQHRGSSDYVVQKINGDQVLSQWAQVNDMLDDGRDNNSIDDTPKTTETKTVEGGRSYTVYSYEDGKGNLLMQKYLLTGMGHAWSGGSSLGNYTDSTGPDASRIIWSFLSGNPIDEGEPENPGGPGEPENPDFEVAYGTATEHYVAGRLNTSEYLQMGSKYGYIARFYLYRLDGTNEWTDVNPIG